MWLSTELAISATPLKPRSKRIRLSVTRRARRTPTRTTTPVSFFSSLLNTQQHLVPAPLTLLPATEDERSIANRLAAANDQNDPSEGSGKKKTAEQIAGEHDPTLPARMHGNEPSRGAKIDKKIEVRR